MTPTPEQIAEARAFHAANDELPYDEDREQYEAACFHLGNVLAALDAALAELEGLRQPNPSTDALDAIAIDCGCGEWEYPGQVVRDVRAVVAERNSAIYTLGVLRSWTHEGGAMKCPPAGVTDSYGEGRRIAQETVSNILNQREPRKALASTGVENHDGREPGEKADAAE